MKSLNREHVAHARSLSASWLAAGLRLSRVVPWTEEQLERVAPWIVAAIGERLDLPPPSVVTDIGTLLEGRHLSSRMRRTAQAAELEAALRRYEDEVLGRLDADPRMGAAADALARLPPELRPFGVGLFATSILSRIGFDRGITLQPGIVRAALRRPAREVAERGFMALRDEPETRDALTAAYESLVRGGKRAGQLISDADVFALENLHVLRSLTQRLAIAQVVDAEEAIARGFPRRVRSTRKSAGDAATKLEDESEYPIGGFSAISTSGTLENLVTSELIYMEDPSHEEGGSGGRSVDLFDMRYTEGELLYYTRDEAILTRQRRTITFLLDDDLTAARVKDMGLPWQRIVLLLGLLMATIQKLSDDLAGDALEVRVVFVRGSPGQPSALRAEKELCELALREWRDKGIVVVVEATMGAEAATLAAASRRALVEVVLFSAKAAPVALTAWFAAAQASKLPERTLSFVVETGLSRAADLAAWKGSAVDLVAALL